MSTYRATASALIQATAQQVYAIIADYRDGHARILPKLPFRALEVEQGGLGAGTIVSFQMEAFGKIQTFRLNTGAVTTFTIDLHASGQQAQVTITTEGKVRDGLAGALERFLTVMFLQHTYTRELKLLAALAEQCSRVDEARR